MRKMMWLLGVLLAAACGEQPGTGNGNDAIDAVAVDYVRLGLAVGQYDASFVDAYYGPDSLQPVGKPGAVFPKDSLLAAVSALSARLKAIETNAADTVAARAGWIDMQLTAFAGRIKLFGGDSTSFDEESKVLYGVTAPVYDSNHFAQLVQQLDGLLPGKGTVGERFQQLSKRFVIPKEKLDTVLKTAIAECRKRTLAHYALPAEESFTLEFVTDKPWSGYNWYKGNYRSVIQINTDLPILIDRAIDVGSHESYPGHHVYNMLLEQHLYREKGWVEISLYPLYSPQSLIAEGSANYGIALAFPGDDKITFSKSVLLPLAGVDTTGITAYYRALAVKEALNYARNEAARGLLNGTMTEPQAIAWLKAYCLVSEEGAEKYVSFIRANRSYVINYNYGKDLVKGYISAHGGDASTEKQWELFGQLLSSEVAPKDLLPAK